MQECPHSVLCLQSGYILSNYKNMYMCTCGASAHESQSSGRPDWTKTYAHKSLYAEVISLIYLSARLKSEHNVC